MAELAQVTPASLGVAPSAARGAAARFATRLREIDDTTQRGITLAQLEEVLREVTERCETERWTRSRDGSRVTPATCNLYDLVEHVLNPKTREHCCSFVGLVASEPHPATVFVSHYWGEPVFAFVACLRQYALDMNDPRACFWICAYANNQHALGGEVNVSLEQTSYYKALKHSGRTVAIIGHGEVFARAWCVYEMYLTLVDVGHQYSWDAAKRLAHGLTAGPSADDIAIAVEMGAKDPSVIKVFREERFPSSVLAIARAFDVADAQEPFEPADRVRILGEIGDAAATVNNSVAAHFCMPLIGAAMRSRRDRARLDAMLEQVAGPRLRALHVACAGRRASAQTTGALVRSLPPTLERVSLVGMAPTVVALLRDEWRGGGGLRELSLSSCALGDAAARTLASLLPSWPQLEHLDLSGGRITSRGARALAGALREHATLRLLNVSNNWIGDGGVCALARAALPRGAQVSVRDNLMVCCGLRLTASERARVADQPGSGQFGATLSYALNGVMLLFLIIGCL
jgi:hypothetical protein